MVQVTVSDTSPVVSAYAQTGVELSWTDPEQAAKTFLAVDDALWPVSVGEAAALRQARHDAVMRNQPVLVLDGDCTFALLR